MDYPASVISPSAAEVAQDTLTPAVLLRHEGELLLLPHPAIQIASTNSISAAARRAFILIFLEARVCGRFLLLESDLFELVW